MTAQWWSRYARPSRAPRPGARGTGARESSAPALARHEPGCKGGRPSPLRSSQDISGRSPDDTHEASRLGSVASRMTVRSGAAVRELPDAGGIPPFTRFCRGMTPAHFLVGGARESGPRSSDTAYTNSLAPGDIVGRERFGVPEFRGPGWMLASFAPVAPPILPAHSSLSRKISLSVILPIPSCRSKRYRCSCQEPALSRDPGLGKHVEPG